MRRIINPSDILGDIAPPKKRGSISSALIEEMVAMVDFIDMAESEYDLVLDESSNGWWQCSCPLPGHRDSSPSFGIHAESKTFNCFGCVADSELIWTRQGLKPIGAVIPGDEVFGLNGRWEAIDALIPKGMRETLMVELDTFRHDPLVLTPDHKCVFVKHEDALKNLPYLMREANGDVRYCGKSRRHSRSPRHFNALRMTEGPASALNPGDYFVFPVAAEITRSSSPLGATIEMTRQKSGPNSNRIKELPVNEKCARLYGLWLAEGSLGRGYVRFTFHMDERHTLAEEVVSTLRDEFGLAASIYDLPDRPNTCEVNCSKTDLGHLLRHWFGEHSHGKRLPSEALFWPQEAQSALLSGYRDGDGDREGRSASVSRVLSYGIYALCVQARQNPSLSRKDAYVDKLGISHRESWGSYSRKREGMFGFYEVVDGVTYYFSRISSVLQGEETSVVDISTSSTHTFTTKMGVVHNCSRKGGMLEFIKVMEGLSFPEAVARLSALSGIGMDADQSDVFRSVRNIQIMTDEYLNRHAETGLPGGMSEVQFALTLAERLRAFENKVGARALGGAPDLAWVDGVYKEVDALLFGEDHKALSQLWRGLGAQMKERAAACAEGAE